MALEDYNAFDRAVHALAFGPEAPRRMLADMEASQLGEALAALDLGAPIFVTALPRAGTTLLLELLAAHPATFTHTYRDMPFVRTPAMWSRLSGPLQKRAKAKERSHGDGMLVSTDSPEAFDEVLWMDGFASHYGAQAIAPWDSALPDAFITRFTLHMRSVAAARGVGGKGLRYLSKNNANIARLSPLAAAFPGAAILVPLRDPLDHAASMLRQHRKALTSHAESRFAARYVTDIGHFEFGAAHRPIAFARFAELAEGHGPDSLDYWLAYWIAAYAHVEREAAATILDMAAITSQASIAPALAAAGLASDPALEAEAAQRLHEMPAHQAPSVSPALLAEACKLHARLAARAAK